MFCWGKLNSTKDNSSHDNINGLDLVLGGTKIRDVSIKEGLMTFIRDSDRKVTVVTSQEQITLDLKKKRVAVFNSGQEHVVLLTEAGTVWEWKHSAESNIPRRFSRLTNICIMQVACGNYHSVVLTNNGQLFTWGQNSSGQLGLGKGHSSFRSPQPLKSLYGIPLAQISAGGNHSFALTLSGGVFGWGKNSAGQLGLGDTDDRYVPDCVKSLNLKKTVFISCGKDHTAVLTKGGLIFTFGSGCYGQLGHNSLRDELQPRVVAEFWGAKVSQVACGRHHTLALVESSNTIYSFGCGEQGQLGNRQRTNQCVPLPVRLAPDYNQDQTIKKITAGGNVSVIFISKTDDVQANSNLSKCNGIAVLNDQMFDRWISNCKSKIWKRRQREIKRMFSSASRINNSFLDKSCDKHYKTSLENSGLDLSLARLAFEKLAKNEKVLLEVEKVVENNLLPTLDSTAAAVEAVRVYLILPELLRVLNKHGRGTQLTVDLAPAIFHLKPGTKGILTSLWNKLPYYYYRTLVKMFHLVCAHFLSLMTTTVCDHWDEVLPVLNVLQMLYDINSRRDKQLNENYFLIKKLIDFFDRVNHYNFRDLVLIMKTKELKRLDFVNKQVGTLITFLDRVEFILRYPFILDMKSKCTVNYFLQVKNEPCFSFGSQNTLCVKRETVLADTFEYLKSSEHNFSLPLKVKFFQEDGVDDGGLRAALFTLLRHEITKDSSVIQASENSGLFWFSADDSASSQEEVFYIGIICGLAFYNNCLMNIGFPVALFKKLLNLSPTLSDLEELSPVEARGLKDLLMEDEDVVENLDLDFTVKGRELIPNGAEIPVTKANRQKYVDLYIDFVFNKSVENQFRQFKTGFSRGSPNSLCIFKPVELRDVLYGAPQYEWEELRKVARYVLCGPSDELIQNFWSVFFELNEEQQKMFLTFVYGTDRLPVGGLSKLGLMIVRRNCEDADERFPSVQTCYGILQLPNYSSIQILRQKLVHAITYCEVFGSV